MSAMTPLAPLHVVCELAPGASVVAFDLPLLDGLLAWAESMRSTGGRGLGDLPPGEWHRIELPLQCLWRDDRGLPLWAATPLRPVGETAEDVATYHRKRQPGTATAVRQGRRAGELHIHSGQGRWAERRIPTPTVAAAALEGWAIGERDPVAELLQRVAFVGKRRGIGHGEVVAWHVETVGAVDLRVADGRLARAVPAGAAAELGLVVEEPPRMVGWTPPHWRQDLWLPGWPAGTVAEVAP